MFRLLLAVLFTFAVLTQVHADDKPKDDAPKVEKVEKAEDTNAILKEIRDEIKKANEPHVVDYFAHELSWKERVSLVGEKITNIAPIVLLVLIAVVLIGMRSDMNELGKVKKD